MKVLGIFALSCVLVPLAPAETRPSDDGFVVQSAVQPAAGGSRSDRPATRALAFFDTDGVTIPEFLARHRPAPLSPALRAQVLAGLPLEGELQPTAAERAKLAAIEPVLDFHGRKGTVEIKVIEVGHAFVGLHARTVLLLSRDALALLTPEEMQAVTGHELGHEYVWNEYQAAMAAAAHPRMQELDLVCDGIAVISLRALGLDPARLITAVTKMTRYNERRGAMATARSYVPLDERRRFIDMMSARSVPRAAVVAPGKAPPRNATSFMAAPVGDREFVRSTHDW
jgi:peptidase M48-like protein